MSKFSAEDKSLPADQLAGSRHRERQSSMLKIKAFPASQYRWGLRVPRIVHGKPGLPGLQYQISFSSLIMHFRIELGHVKPRLRS